MKEEDLNQIKVVVSDTMSDFYHDVLQKRFNNIDQRFNNIDNELTDLRITSEALVKIVDYARLEAKVLELSQRLEKLEKQSNK